MNPLLRNLLIRYMAPAGDGGSDTGGAGTGADDGDDLSAADRGDDFVPTGDEAGGEGEGAAAAAEKGGEGEPGKGEGGEEDPEKAKADADDKAKGKDTRIPLSRHKDLLEKERARRTDLERQLASYQQGRQVAAVNEGITKLEDNILALEKEYNKLMADGDVDKATEAMSKIRRMEREVSEQKSDLKIAAAEARATETARYSIVLERIEGAYPELNEDHEDYDEEVVADVLDLKAAYQSRRGMPPAAALQAAVQKLLGKKTAGQKDAVNVTPRVPRDDSTAADRKKKAVEKALDANRRTPPSAAQMGQDSDKLGGGAVTAKDAMKMSDEDFAKLDEKTLARMRGDEL